MCGSQQHAQIAYYACQCQLVTANDTCLQVCNDEDAIRLVTSANVAAPAVILNVIQHHSDIVPSNP